MNNTIKNNHQTKTGVRRGFTLIEMLISVTLVLLMMTMFTSIFQMATNSVSVQRGIAQNDQAARALTTTLKSDIAKRSNRYLLPYYPTEQESTSPTSFGDRGGYVYISTNDPDSWQDDILQFTVNAKKTQEDPDDALYFGRAELLYNLQQDPAFGDTVRRTTLRHNPNQPDADDASLGPNQVAASSAAEVSYFVRNGSLYRRVMLLREPLPVGGGDLDVTPYATISPIPTSGPTTDPYFGTAGFGGWFTYVGSPNAINYVDSSDPDHFFLGSGEIAPNNWGVTASNDFWRHFDFSAVPVPLVSGSLPTNVAFNGIESLDNSGGLTSLGNPIRRFGFNPWTGLSREHDNPIDLQFIGRFLQAETSHTFFNWPAGAARLEPDEVPNSVHLDAANCVSALSTGGAFLGDDGGGGPGNGNPMDLAGTYLHLDKSSGVINELAGTTGRGGTRMVEDLLMANVHGMKVEVWDDRLERYVTPGHSDLRRIADAGGGSQLVAGDYHIARNLNPTYGPRGGAAPSLNRVFDTWNPALVASGAPASPPFVAYRYYPPLAPLGPTPTTAPDPTVEYDPTTGVARNRGYWAPSQNYSVGDVVFAVPAVYVANGVAGWDADGDGNFEWSRSPGGDQDPGIMWGSISNPGFPSQGFQIAYRCVTAGTSDAVPPTWPRGPNQKFSESGGSTVQWISIDNRRPLRSIRVTVNFFDQGTEKLRQLSLELPMTTER